MRKGWGPQMVYLQKQDKEVFDAIKLELGR
ncbi:hypothetical protein ACYREM_13770, partial [Listeria monocytogenes]